jgi:hypothetical protein
MDWIASARIRLGAVRTLALGAACVALASPLCLRAQVPSVGRAAGPTAGLTKNATLALALRDISPANIRHTDSVLVAFGTRHTLSDTTSATRGIGAARRYIYATLDSISSRCGGCLHVEYDPAMVPLPRAPNHPPVNVVNVLAWLPGRDTSRVVVLTGHYDSCRCALDAMDSVSDAPGADDDASGTSDVIELARVFAHRFPKGLDATILFAAVAGEEQGLLGSTHLAKRLHDGGYRVSGDMSDDIDGNVSSDNGHTDSTSMRIYSGDPDNSPGRELARYADALAALYHPGISILEVYRIDRIGRGTDHEPFVALGEPGIRTTERMEALDRQHSPNDVFSHVNFRYAAHIARVNALVLGAVGAAPAAPDSVRIKRLPPYGLQWQMSWQPVPGATGYEVLLRSTTTPAWQRVIAVGDSTSTVVHAQLDDLWAGVRSIGAHGERSPATVVPEPRPARRPPQR